MSFESSTNQPNKNKKKSISSAERSGLTLPPSRFRKILYKNTNRTTRIGRQSPVCFASIIEYVLKEIIEIASEITASNGRKTISKRDIIDAINSDPELAIILSKLKIVTNERYPNAHFITIKRAKK